MTAFFKTNKQVVIHLLCWTVFLFVIFIQIYIERGEVPLFLFARILIDILFFYINFLFLVPKLLLKKKTVLYLLSIVIILICFFFINKYFRNLFLIDAKEFFRNINFDKGRRTIPFLPKSIPILLNIAFLVIGTTIRVYIEWNKNETRKKEIESLRTTTQLQYLKGQVNPHFLFNSLNTIYSLTTKKSNNAPEAVITLSELMRYMLYRTNSEFVPLSEELDYIKNYIKLQRLRLANGEKVTLNIHGNVAGQRIRPLLLISFIENAFKYGTDYQGNTEIKIIITIKLNHLHFTCVNLIGSTNINKENSGIGLTNTKARLNLLYPNNKLTVSKTDGKFNVELSLTLE